MGCPAIPSDSCDWRPWGTRSTTYGRVERVRCRICRRVRDKNPNRPAFGLRKGQQRVGADGASRWMDFWSRVGRRFGWAGLPKALEMASEEVGVARSTGWRWVQRIDVDSAPRPKWVSPTTWRFLGTCIEEYRRGRAQRHSLGDISQWVDSCESGWLTDLAESRGVLDAIVDARLVAAVLAGERTPCWVDRIMRITRHGSFHGATRPSVWGELSDALERAAVSYGTHNHRSVKPSAAERTWMAWLRTPGVGDVLHWEVVDELQWKEELEPDDERIPPFEVPPSFWRPRRPWGFPTDVAGWRGEADRVPHVDPGWFEHWRREDLFIPARRVFFRAMSAQELLDPVMISWTPTSIEVTAKAGDGTGVRMTVPEQPSEKAGRGTVVVYPGRMKPASKQAVVPRDGMGNSILLRRHLRF